MKKTMILAVMTLMMALSASAMSYEQARNEALFLTDKMAYELNLTDAQYEAAYEINLDYLMGVATYDDVFGTYWERRNLDLSYILYSWQWDLFRAATYFYRPLYWDNGFWHFAVYARYPRRDYFYFGRPHFYATYRGGHSWRLNGNRSYYHGRSDHFRPALAHDRRHVGMRDGFDQGHFRGARGGNSSTRVTAGRDGQMNDRRSGNFSGPRNNNNSRPDNRANTSRDNVSRPSGANSSGNFSNPRSNPNTGSSSPSTGSSSPRVGTGSQGTGSSRSSGSFRTTPSPRVATPNTNSTIRSTAPSRMSSSTPSRVNSTPSRVSSAPSQGSRSSGSFGGGHTRSGGSMSHGSSTRSTAGGGRR